MAKHTLKILRCLHRKILRYVWSFFNVKHERVKIFKNFKTNLTSSTYQTVFFFVITAYVNNNLYNVFFAATLLL